MFDVKLVTSRKSSYCGPCCLKMILDYYGISSNLDMLAKDLGVGVAGCTAADMLRVGRAHGLTDMAVYSMPPEEMLTADRPGIVWWEYNHFVVLCGMNEKGEAVLCNPSRGKYPLDAETFAKKCAKLQDGKYVILCNGMPEDLPEVE